MTTAVSSQFLCLRQILVNDAPAIGIDQFINDDIAESCRGKESLQRLPRHPMDADILQAPLFHIAFRIRFEPRPCSIAVVFLPKLMEKMRPPFFNR